MTEVDAGVQMIVRQASGKITPVSIVGGLRSFHDGPTRSEWWTWSGVFVVDADKSNAFASPEPFATRELAEYSLEDAIRKAIKTVMEDPATVTALVTNLKSGVKFLATK